MTTHHTYAAHVEMALGCILLTEQQPAAKFAQCIKAAIPEAQHFALPEGGRLFDDDLRGLDPDLSAARLPFPTITVSFANGRRRTLVVAREREDAEQPARVSIEILVAVDTGDGQGWGYLPGFARPVRNHSDSSVSWQCFDLVGDQSAAGLHEALAANGRSVLELIEALSCNNVTAEIVERIDPAVNTRRRRAGKLPLYEVRRLVVKVGDAVHAVGAPIGDRNGPREHLRRGHVRRLPDGRRTWVQCCVVGARSLGVVRKSAYVVEVA